MDNGVEAMQKLKCDICGGQIEIQPDKRGLCMNCGAAYSLKTMKDMFDGIKISVTGSGEDVEQWRQLLKRYFAAGDYIEAERVVKKIMEAVPSDPQAAAQYEQLQVIKFMDVRNGILKAYSGNSTVVTVPDVVTAIDPEVFSENEYIEEVFLPEGLKIIRHGLFAKCNRLRKVHIPDTVTVIEDKAFEFCFALNDVVLPDSLNYIGDRAFGSCTSLTEINIPSSVQTIGTFNNNDMLFDHSEKSTGHIINNYFENDAKGVFSFCSKLKKVVFNCGLREIGSYTFYKTALEDVELPDGVEKIGKLAFGECITLKRLVIPDSITTFYHSWAGCYNLEFIIYPKRFSPYLFSGTVYYSKNIQQIKQEEWRLKKEELRSKGLCQYCGGTFGRFLGTCKKCGKPKDY